MAREQSLTISVQEKSLGFFPHGSGKEVARIGCRRANLRSGGKFVWVKRFRPGSLNRYQKSTAKKLFH